MKRNRQQLIFGLLVLLLLILLIFFGLRLLLDDTAQEIDRPFPFRRQEFQAESEPEPTYEEIAVWQFPEMAGKALAVMPDATVYLAGKGLLLSVKGGLELNRTPLAESDLEPRALVVDRDSDIIFIAYDRRLDLYDMEGIRIAQWDNFPDRSRFTSIVLRESDIFIADAGQRLVLQIDRKNGRILAEIGRRDPDKAVSGFVVPSPYFDLAIGVDDSLWVVDPGRHTLRNYGSDAELRSSWHHTGLGVENFCGCCNPTHIAILPDGAFVTSEKGIVRIKIYDPDGTFRELVAGVANFAEDTIIYDLGTDAAGQVFVLDSKRNALRVFRRIKR